MKKKNSIQRHCMVVHAYYPVGETRVEREARELDTHGINVDVICLKYVNEPPEQVIDGIHVYRIPVMRHKDRGVLLQLFEYFLFFILAMYKLTSLHIKHRYNVIQVHNLPDWLVFVGLFPRLMGTKIILDLHDLMPEFYAARFNRNLNSWPVKLIRWQEQISCWFANRVITVTDNWQEVLINRGIPSEKISVVMNVPDDRIFISTLENGNINNNGSYKLLYHGNLTYRYGIDLAIRAIRLLLDQIPGMHLHIHGAGDARESLINLVDEMQLGEYVSFNKHTLLTSELPRLIQEADVCLVPYRRDVFTDGILPTKLMEYVAMGKPVITARTPAINKYFDDSMVQFFEPGNVDDLARCILMLYKDLDRKSALVLGSQNFNQRFNWSKIGAEYLSLVERLGKHDD